jgi:hypothetical protein
MSVRDPTSGVRPSLLPGRVPAGTCVTCVRARPFTAAELQMALYATPNRHFASSG